MVDTIIVGRCIGNDALAAVGSTGALSFLILGFAMGITSGFSVIASQRFGAQDEEGVKRSAAASTLLCIFITILLTAISLLTVKPLLHLMNTPEDIFQDAYIYISIIFIGIGASIYYNMIAGILRALGDSKTPLYFLILSSLLNIGLDLLFILTFSMGVAGAAWATILSQLISAVLCTLYAAKRFPILQPETRPLSACSALCGPIFARASDGAAIFRYSRWNYGFTKRNQFLWLKRCCLIYGGE